MLIGTNTFRKVIDNIYYVLDTFIQISKNYFVLLHILLKICSRIYKNIKISCCSQVLLIQVTIFSPLENLEKISEI